MVIEPELLALREARPDLLDAIDVALVGTRSTEAGAIFAWRLADNPNEMTLIELGQVGPAAVEAGPEVVKLLSSENWEIRRAAVEALGEIGYQRAVPDLIAMLEIDNDVLLTHAVVEALGKLRGPASDSALRKISSTFWYPPVRDAALDALDRSAGETEGATESETRWVIGSAFFSGQLLSDLAEGGT